ncbi:MULTISPECIES: hypothetical protein [unclassified Moorena]|uniref:hypothetical protein n=1 Tax=unclassified Moorena TaxID=2683338 RepID=UPI0013B9FA6C|nr:MULTISPECIES: hypothetical protein [unclassified Moorena]NEQ16191.1 hypothetical protein [Moorena sp. SIO3E2]NES81982.1 hypothetical protein [Moorena sp. SIO2B7]NEQ04442.1 hypothetical protein [Moorena sp. SIO4E2]NES42091.1 hypothetical protein [Moorena sp. SIO2C4]NET66551.1 hypothetical protein [Moorena sp. SIO1G6]
MLHEEKLKNLPSLLQADPIKIYKNLHSDKNFGPTTDQQKVITKWADKRHADSVRQKLSPKFGHLPWFIEICGYNETAVRGEGEMRSGYEKFFQNWQLCN